MKITLTSSQFADFCLFFLLDKLQNPEEVIPPDYDEKFNAVAEIMKRRGIRSALFWFYVKSDPMLRVKYRLIRNIFRPDNPSKVAAWIEIIKDPTVKPKAGLISRLMKHIKNILTLSKNEEK